MFLRDWQRGPTEPLARVAASFYLHAPDVERLALADEDLSDQARGDVARCVYRAVVQSRQTLRVRFGRLVLVHHSPQVGVCLPRLDAMGLVAWQT